MAKDFSVFEFVADTRKDSPEGRKTGVPFHLLGQNACLRVSWGDGTDSMLTPSLYAKDDASCAEHEYASPGRYRVAVYAAAGCGWEDIYLSTLDCQDADFELSRGFNAKTECIRLFKKTLVEMSAPLPPFKGTLQFYTTSPDRLFSGTPVKANFSYVFLHCTALEEVADNLFEGIRNSVSFAYAFYGCRSLRTIPESLFKGCTEAEEFTYAFFGCSSVRFIPSNLFKDTYKARIFKGCFKDCSCIEELPRNLFRGAPMAELFSDCFQNCISLKSIPRSLFAHNPLAVSFSRTFENCSSLTAVPRTLFWNCPSASFFKSTFSKTGLASIPAELFYGCPNAYTFSYAFAWCRDITEVPEGLFAEADCADSFFGCFCGCTSLERIGRKLFERCISVHTFNTCFYGCERLLNVRLDLPSRSIDNVHLMFDQDANADRVLYVPKASSVAKMLKLKERELSVRVEERLFLIATLKTLVKALFSLPH